MHEVVPTVGDALMDTTDNLFGLAAFFAIVFVLDLIELARSLRQRLLLLL